MTSMDARSSSSIQPIIEAKHLRKSFGSFTAVDDISFTVPPGECFGILGPNGAGKTTAIRMLYGFSPMTGGTLRIFGLDVPKDIRSIKARIGVCQQENNLDPDLTVFQNMEIFAGYFNLPRMLSRERAESLLSFIALSNRRNDKVIELSGGMMRRLVLARALINSPDLLILDEPTTGLDPQSRHQVWQRLEELKKSGLTILLTTHYMDEASWLCDRLIIMDHGRILVEGPPAELIRTHVGHDVIEVAEPAPALLDFVAGMNLEYENLGHRLIIYGNNRDVLYHEISAHCSHEGCILRMATLEDVFLKLTGRELRE
ncbi:ABC transporter ATP-binding protein [Syntrophus aciditrophicus]|uniref:ABC transporter ATP-binding protein n=1 Tax=Syntrophus aciditrophicus (strain SB) TaxID=56780 RepID=Q2LVT9_SYNAS|nr:ABC transporter ATP-binding protein [Syntrophus aciditrophicus]ABC78199.1 ABC transporter ATP-binding protein [Syntrophus aciditrophicus SB]